MLMFLLKPLGWYGVSKAEVWKRGGAGLFYKYSSMDELLQTLYPDYNWDRSKFIDRDKARQETRRKSFWAIKENQRKFLDQVAKDLSISQVSLIALN